MTKSQKIWVIDDEGETTRIQDESPSEPTVPSQDRKSSNRTATAQPSFARQQSPLSKSGAISRDRSLGILVALTYLLGPLSLLLTSQGRRRKSWLVAGMAAGLTVVALALTWQDNLVRFAPGSPVAIGWFLTALLTISIGFTIWAKSIHLHGSTAGFAAQRLPWWCRTPAVVGLLGFLLPGFGMLVMGRPRRAAWALWLVGPVVQSLLVLAHAGWLWRGSRGAHPGFISSQALEVIFLVTAAVLGLGLLMWLVQALDALRLVTHGVGARYSRRVYWLAAFLAITLVLFAVWFDPATLADDLDRYAISFHAEGMQLIPLAMTLSAVHLDPARPEYVIHTADLYTLLGREQRASELRQELARRWLPYAMALRRSGHWNADAGSLTQSPGKIPGVTLGEVWRGQENVSAEGIATESKGGRGEGVGGEAEDFRHGPYLDVIPAWSEDPPIQTDSEQSPGEG